MPIFEYYCQSCNLRFEELVFSSQDTPKCPACGNKQVNKELSTFGVSMGGPSGCGDGGCGMDPGSCGTGGGHGGSCPCCH
ncbi:MAG: zinc ribbon domain-containing protein [bacterium]|nr:zinc ribbon domain-containing protein [bacterium]